MHVYLISEVNPKPKHQNFPLFDRELWYFRSIFKNLNLKIAGLGTQVSAPKIKNAGKFC